MPEKSYIVAPRSAKRADVSPQWMDQLQRIPGVKVQAVNIDQARIRADENGIRAVRASLGADFLIEGEFLRSL